MKILLQGYYGFGNLGDDLLFRITFRLIKQLFPLAEIHIHSNSEQSEYLTNIIGEEILIIDYRTKERYDLIVHGGGGVHFDYRSSGFFYACRNLLIKLIGEKNTVYSYNLLKKIFFRKSISADLRIGIGIGIGTYVISSKKYLSDLLIFHDYDHLFVRDHISYKLSNIYPIRGTIYESADLVFLDKKLLSNESRNKNKVSKIGIILRDWYFDSNKYLDIFYSHFKYIMKEYDLTFFSMDPNDKVYIDKFSGLSDIFIYTPSSEGIESFINLMDRQDLIISSRAHGIYLSACLYKPSLCINIEKKIEQVHQCIYNSSRLIPVDCSFNLLHEEINYVFKNYSEFIDKAIKDFEINYENANNIKEFLNELPRTIQKKEHFADDS